MLGAIALALGLVLWGWDDVFSDLSTTWPMVHRVCVALEFLLLGPGMAVMAFLFSEYLRMAEVALADERARSRQQRLVALGRVAAGLAHEVRNPLHNIRLLIEETRIVEQVDERSSLLARVDANLVRIDHAVELVYRLARPATANTSEVSCDLVAVVNEAVATERQRLPGRVTFTLSLPAQAAAGCATEDVRMALDNLLRNASAAATEVRVMLQRSGPAWEVLVANRGELPTAIAALGQGDGLDSSKPGGLGLGLAISRQLLEEASGSLTIVQAGNEVQARIRLPAVAS